MDQEIKLFSRILPTLFSLFKIIYRMAATVKANEERSQKLTKRVKSIEKLVLKIQETGRGQISPSLEDTLRDLSYTLQATEVWMKKYTQTKDWKRFLKGGSLEEKFRTLNEDLSENFERLSLALLAEYGEKIDKIHDTLMQKGPAAITWRAPTPCLCSPKPTPAAQILVPSRPQLDFSQGINYAQALVPSRPQLDPFNFSQGINYAPFSQTFNPIIPQPVSLSNSGFSNTICNPSWVSQSLNFSNMAPMNGVLQYSSVAFSNNGTVTCVTKGSFCLFQTFDADNN